MKRGLLQRLPTLDDLARLYHELAKYGAPAVGRDAPWPYAPEGFEGLLALAGEMVRYDPRLLSIGLELVLQRWESLNPLVLRRRMAAMECPQALLVVFEFSKEAAADPELRYMVDYLAVGHRAVSPVQQFFLDAALPGSRTRARLGSRSLTAYSRWGFIGTERPAASATRKTRLGRYDAKTRQTIRRRLVERRGAFTIRDYLAALDGGITRQQAYRDLRDDPEFELEGRGPGARWRARKRSRRGPGSRPDSGR